ncbi:probable FBD-associated F-box protein At1g32375 [Cryptomeria japonica]|uniref:probable FBD-associated F-box protein At1g32375 n=1 Tax=Cryptomeria japonica TaxID=3369 RepID=UPI0027DAAFEB|nr:probable FBD-associated F-box protein At1g32375 [Cryptomeria japonica]
MDLKRNLVGLNDLPDSLLIYILSKVPLKQAVRCSLLCKRWKFICNLEVFEFSNNISFEIRDKLSKWIHQAVLKDNLEDKFRQSSFSISLLSDRSINSELPTLDETFNNERFSSEDRDGILLAGNTRYTALGVMQQLSNAVFPDFSASSSLKNLKRVHLNMTLFYDATRLLAYLLPRSPALKSISVSRKKGFDGARALRFINRVLNLQQQFPGTKILLSRDTVKEGRCLNCDLEDFH